MRIGSWPSNFILGCMNSYGNHVVSQPGWQQRFVLEHWHGLDLQSDDLPQLGMLQGRATKELNSASFHWHTN